MRTTVSHAGRRAVLSAFLCLLAGCGLRGPPGSTVAVASEGMWRSLHRPRPEAIDPAARVSVSNITVLNEDRAMDVAISLDIGLSELVSAGLLRRRDVRFVERRRFSEAVERERRGFTASRSAPPTGTSPGVEYVLSGAWIALGESSTLALRLVEAETGVLAAGFKANVPSDADLPAVARLAVGSTLAALQQIGRRPNWRDPLGPTSAPEEYEASNVPTEAVEAFFRGVLAEDRFDWEEARRGYQLAQEIAGDAFFEPAAALARVARLRAGGSLGASD